MGRSPSAVFLPILSFQRLLSTLRQGAHAEDGLPSGPGDRQAPLHALSHEACWINADVRSVELSPVPDFLSKTHVATNGLGAFQPVFLRLLDSTRQFR